MYVVGGRESCRVCNEVYASSSSLTVLLLLLLSLQFQNIQQLYTIRHPHTSTFLRYFCFAVVVAHPVVHPILSIQECIVGGIQRRRSSRAEGKNKVAAGREAAAVAVVWWVGSTESFRTIITTICGYSWLEMVLLPLLIMTVCSAMFKFA